MTIGSGPFPELPAVEGGVWRAAAEASHVPICLSDPHAPDEPLVWVNAAFTRVTGYPADAALGRNCRFLQGPDTDRAVVARIRTGLRREAAVTETLLNHRSDGTPFWNQLSLSPLLDASGSLEYYVGVQDDVTARVEALAARDDALAEARQTGEALAVASAREHEAALTLQTGLLPRLRPVRGLDVAARYLPSTAGVAVGGDWYDVIALPDGRIAVTVGDVVGHDLRAAAAMGQLRAMTRALAWSDPSPSHVVGRLDELARAVLDVPFATLFYGVVTLAGPEDPASMTWVRAGHPPPLLRAVDGDVTALDAVVDPPVGVIGGRPVTATTSILPVGSVLLLFTDGLVESRTLELGAGLARLAGVVRDVQRGVTAAVLLEAVVSTLVPASPLDDTCVLAVAPAAPGATR